MKEKSKIKIPDFELATLEFDGKAIWLSKQDKYMLVCPAKTAGLSQEEAKNMCLDRDFVKESNTYNYSFQKITKEGFVEYFGAVFNCEYEVVMMRLFNKINDDFVEYKMPEDDPEHVKCILMKQTSSNKKGLN